MTRTRAEGVLEPPEHPLAGYATVIPHAYSRGKAICLPRYLSVVVIDGTEIARSWVLGICAPL